MELIIGIVVGIITKFSTNYGPRNAQRLPNDALFRAQKNTDSIVQDTDAMSVDHEYRLTLLELGLSE